jgi:hypothetical protein
MTDKRTITNFEVSDSKTERFFNNYFRPDLDVSSNINDAIFTNFEKITDNKESALALASAVINTSKSRQLDVMEVLAEFNKMGKDQLNAYLCMFLNINRVNSSLLGINNQPVKNKYIQRSILP